MKKEIKLGIFVLAVFVVFAFFIIKTESCSEFFSRGKRYPLIAKFTTAAGMYTSASVRLAGVKIGVVDKIYLENRKAVVQIKINNKYKIRDDARVIISTIGFVGEKYVEIVYKDEFKTDNPQIIPPGGEIQVLEPFNLDEIKTKFENIYDRIISITDSINDIVSDKYSKDSLRASFINLKSITEKLNSMLNQDGNVYRVFDNLNQISAKLSGTATRLDHLIVEMDSAFTDPDEGMLGDFKNAIDKIDRITADLIHISEDLRSGKGTAGKLLQDEQLYKKVDDSVSSLQSILEGLEKGKSSLDAITFNYAVHFDYFTRLKKARPALEMDVSMPQFLILAGVNADPINGDPRFTVLGGKKIAFFSIRAGLIESDLGAALRVSMLGSRLNLDVFAYRFYRETNPILKALLSFSLSKNINIQAGYYDLLEPLNREFMVGISFGN
ncbi:MAG: MCE family protein [Candidatus Aminicenantes bacterium]|nr:MCE family protein [Candidatus Aminicenantes bacterium]